MKLYATVEGDRACKSQGSNKKMRMYLCYGDEKNSRTAVLIVANVLPKEASRNNKQCIVVQVWGKNKELCPRLVLPLLKGKRPDRIA